MAILDICYSSFLQPKKISEKQKSQGVIGRNDVKYSENLMHSFGVFLGDLR